MWKHFLPVLLLAFSAVVGARLDAAVDPRAAAIDRPPVHAPRERRMLADSADGVLQETTLFEASLIAAGTDPANRGDAHARFQALVERMPNRSKAEPLETARFVHRMLREHVLVGPFRDDAFDVAETLRGGAFNCLTATILLNELCRARNLDAVAVFVPGHVYTRIEGAAPFDVQITCEDWFSRPEVQTDIGRHLTATQAPRRLGEVQLVARIYYNRGIRAHRKAAYAAAVELLETATRLDPGDEAASRNRLAAINNWALEECGLGRYPAALEILDSARPVAPAGESFRQNAVYIRGRWADALAEEGRFMEAERVLREGQRRMPDETFFDRALRALEVAKRQRAASVPGGDLTAPQT